MPPDDPTDPTVPPSVQKGACLNERQQHPSAVARRARFLTGGDIYA